MHYLKIKTNKLQYNIIHIIYYRVFKQTVIYCSFYYAYCANFLNKVNHTLFTALKPFFSIS